MENIKKGLTVPKWVLIVQPKIPHLGYFIYLPNLTVHPKSSGFQWKKTSLGVHSPCAHLCAAAWLITSMESFPEHETKELHIQQCFALTSVLGKDKGQSKTLSETHLFTWNQVIEKIRSFAQLNSKWLDCKKIKKKQDWNMYGLLLLNLQEFVCEKYGDKKWDAVKEALKLGDVS